MNPQQTANLRKFLLVEAFESTESMFSSVGLLASYCSSTHLLEHVDEEPDVYINNYFEEVVPHYSNATYQRHFRMSRDTMSVLIEELKTVFTGEGIDTENMTVPLAKKVHVTLWMLANYAVTFRECGTIFGMSTGTVHFIMMQICTALGLLQTRYIKWPNIQQCEEHAAEIVENTGFPGVIGSVDGCHIEIKAPVHNAYDYYNRKQFHSVVLQGTCDKNLKFTDIFVGVPGRVHDARVFRLSPLNRQINRGLIHPDMHILADSAYSLHENILSPFRDNGHLTRAQTRYNSKHSAIRSMIERAFGLLKNKFRRLRYLDMSLEGEITIVIAACCVLHNFILLHEGYEEGEDIPDDLDEVPDLHGNRPFDLAGGRDKRNNIANMM